MSVGEMGLLLLWSEALTSKGDGARAKEGRRGVRGGDVSTNRTRLEMLKLAKASMHIASSFSKRRAAALPVSSWRQVASMGDDRGNEVDGE